MKNRRKHARIPIDDYLMVFDRQSGRHIGGLANLSETGAMLVTLEPVGENSVIPCRVELGRPVLDNDEVVFDAECRWCRKNVKRGWWESGYRLKNVSPKNQELLSYLILRFVMGEWETPGPIDIDGVERAERRLVQRFAAKEHLTVIEQRSSRRIGGLANLSLSGAMLTTLEPVEPGAKLQCRVQLPKRIFQRDYLMLAAECVWCKKNSAKGWYESGYRLKNVSELDAVIIMHLMIHYLEAQPVFEPVPE